jgi:hypothetical protein
MNGGFDIAQLPNQQQQQMDPSIKVLQEQDQAYGGSLQQQFANEAGALEQQYLTDEQFTGKSAALTAKYQNAWLQRKYASENSVRSINRIKTMVAQGQMDARLGEQAMFKMVLEPEAFAAKYPKPPTERKAAAPMSSSGVRSASTLMGEFASGFEEKRGYEWGKPKMTMTSMVDQYADWQVQVGYDQLDALHQRQLDQRWDAMMKSDKQYSRWFTKDSKEPIAEVKALRAKSKLGKEMSKRLVPQSTRAIDSPIGKSVRKTMFKQSANKVAPPSKQDLEAARTPAAYEQGVKLGYWK